MVLLMVVLHDAPSLLDYRIPTSLDCPDFESLIIESNDPEGPYGAKEAGEGPLHPSLPAIANAIYDPTWRGSSRTSEST